jgi:cyclopropane-fatty-acyl-phospholipid synthase
LITFLFMADKKDIDFTYTTLDKIFRLSIGETADFSGAMYNGDFSMTLKDAQRKKHNFIADQLNIHEGSKVIEMGSGWGPFLQYASKQRGAKILGLTLSDGQYNACRKKGFDVQIRDCRTVKPEDFGMFDAIVSVGAFEHFCSAEEYKNGQQEKVYTDFFKMAGDLLPKGGRFFLQTMTFTDKMLPLERLSMDAPKNSDEYILALTAKHLPGSWLPYGSGMITKNASPFFKVVNISSGMKDYIETISQWRKMLRKFNFNKYGLYLKLMFEFLKNKQFRHLIPVFRISPIKLCFERGLMDHYRIVFEKV